MLENGNYRAKTLLTNLTNLAIKKVLKQGNGGCIVGMVVADGWLHHPSLATAKD